MSQAVKKFAHRFLNTPCSEVDYFVNFKSVSRPMWISSCKKMCQQKLSSMDETYDFVIMLLEI